MICKKKKHVNEIKKYINDFIKNVTINPFPRKKLINKNDLLIYRNKIRSK